MSRTASAPEYVGKPDRLRGTRAGGAVCRQDQCCDCARRATVLLGPPRPCAGLCHRGAMASHRIVGHFVCRAVANPLANSVGIGAPSTGKCDRVPIATGGTRMKKSGAQETNAPSQLIDAKIAKLGDWRGEMLKRLRALIHEADPKVIETLKWAKASNPTGVPVWEDDGIICTGETYKDKVKLTFANGAALADPSGLFNSSLDGNVRRAIDFYEGNKINEKAFKALIRAAVAHNMDESKR